MLAPQEPIPSLSSNEEIEKKIDSAMSGLKKRGYTIKLDTDQNRTLYQIYDRSGQYQGAPQEILNGRPSAISHGASHEELQKCLDEVTSKSAQLRRDGGDEINTKTMELEALGFKTQSTRLTNSIKVEVTIVLLTNQERLKSM